MIAISRIFILIIIFLGMCPKPSISQTQSDTSKSVWAIVMPETLVIDIDMLQVLLGSAKDSVVSEFIMNTGSWKFRVNSIYIQGADASAFSLVSGFPKYTIESNQSHHAEFRFIPNRVGLHSAEIVIVTQAETIIQNIIGEGVEPKLQIVNSLIDFGTIYVGDFVDSMQAVTVKNIGNAPFEILDTKHNYPNDVDFSTLAGGGNFILQPGEQALMDLRFSANSPGRTSGTLEFHYEGVGSPAVVQLFGKGIIDNDSSAITLNVLDAKGYASDGVKVYIVVTDSYLMQLSRTESFSLELNFNPSMLYPLDYTMDYIDERNAKIKIEDLPTDVKTGDTLATVWFRAGLGNAEISKLELTNIEAIGGNTTISHEDGTFKLLGICYEGGTRLFNANSKAGIASVNPNPAENSIQINVSFSEGGQTEILLYNLKGEIVRTIFNADIRDEKSISLDADMTDLANGSYTLIFKSPTILQKTQLLIVK
ncbi:MAG: choice-of-anchor D domain-containing protein [Candidatus Kapabacteria bacterium]|nr:choice-of-anchor D domain-containing protein [Candidatus Kapabacteria bacterium]